MIESNSLANKILINDLKYNKTEIKNTRKILEMEIKNIENLEKIESKEYR